MAYIAHCRRSFGNVRPSNRGQYRQAVQISSFSVDVWKAAFSCSAISQPVTILKPTHLIRNISYATAATLAIDAHPTNMNFQFSCEPRHLILAANASCLLLRRWQLLHGQCSRWTKLPQVGLSSKTVLPAFVSVFLTSFFSAAIVDDVGVTSQAIWTMNNRQDQATLMSKLIANHRSVWL